MRARDAIAESWYLRTIKSYPPEVQRQLLSQEDQFRNPVGHQLRNSLLSLTEELKGSMDCSRLAKALDTIIRIRAVQNFDASDAVQFVFFAKDAVREHEQDGEHQDFDRRVDQLALMAFDVYMRCREQILIIRAREAANAMSYRSARQ